MKCKGAIGSFVLFFLYIPFICAQPVLDTICTTEDPSHMAVPLRAGSTYNWNVNGGRIISGHETNDILVDWNGGDGLYTVSVVETDSNGCEGDPVEAGIYLIYPDTASIIGPEEVCRGKEVLLKASAGRDFIWSDGSSDPVISFFPERDTTVFLVALNPGCGNDTAYHSIKVNRSLRATMEHLQDTVYLNSELDMFYNGLDARKVEWMIDDYYLGEGYYISKEFNEEGLYRITQIVHSGNCTDTLYKDIYVDDQFAVYIPNSFTPNGDNVNDIFLFKGKGIKSYTARIYNRWGQFLYEWTESAMEGWDGTYNGMPAKQDTYVYDIIVEDYRKRQHKFTGYFSLIP